MKKISILLLVGAAIISNKAISQIIPTYKAVDSAINKKKSGDDKSTFANVFNAFAEVAGTESKTILIQPTLYSIISAFNPKVQNDKNFEREKFSRNLQLNLGISAAEKSIFKYDSSRLGFTYAILNNKKLKKQDYDNLKKSREFADYDSIQNVLAKYSTKNIGNAGELLGEKLFKYGISKNDINNLPTDLKKMLLDALSLSIGDEEEIVKKIDGFDKLYKKQIKDLSKKTSLLFDFASVYNFQNKHWEQLNISPLNYYQYFFKSWKKSPSININVGFNFGTDTIRKELLKREIFQTNIGFNFLIINNQDDEPIFEIKPGVTYTNISKGKYESEKKSKFDPTAIFRVRINKDFFLPVKINYDTDKKKLFGALSIQFSI